MAEDKMTLFELAEKKNEFLRFALGKGEYFIPDREFGEHWILESWKREILPLLQKFSEQELNVKLAEMLLSITNHTDETEAKVKLNAMLYHISTYYYLRQLGHFKGDALYLHETKLVAAINQLAELSGSKSDSNFVHAIKLIQKRSGLSSFSLT